MVAVSISELQPGETAKVCGFAAGNKAYRQKLLSMGLTPSTCFQVVRTAPLGDPVMIKLRHYHLSLRKDEAALLKLERVTDV
jgi:ferrous iron transport protein A